jgi:hypothetical protein
MLPVPVQAAAIGGSRGRSQTSCRVYRRRSRGCHSGLAAPARRRGQTSRGGPRWSTPPLPLRYSRRTHVSWDGRQPGETSGRADPALNSKAVFVGGGCPIESQPGGGCQTAQGVMVGARDIAKARSHDRRRIRPPPVPSATDGRVEACDCPAALLPCPGHAGV